MTRSCDHGVVIKMSTDLLHVFSVSKAPEGLFTALSDLTLEDGEKLTLLCEEAFSHVCPSDVAQSHTVIFSHDEKSKQSIAALTFIYRNSKNLGLTAESLQEQLNNSTVLTPGVIKAITDTWEHKGARQASEALRLISVGKLIGVSWKFGVAVTSNSCKTLRAPFVTLVITLADSSSQVVTKSFEMNLQEFQSFSKQMKEMATHLETM